MVLYGIKVSNNTLIYSRSISYFISSGETNRDFNRDYYTCSFSKMITYWRQMWNNRTNGSTDIEFPFGFVQVSVTGKLRYLRIYIYIYSWQHSPPIRRKSVVFHGFAGIKHLTWVMFQITLFQKCLWLLHAICVMIPMGQWTFSLHPFELHVTF